MTLSQSFLISLSMLICFSPIMSLEMSETELEPLNRHHVITVYNTFNRGNRDNLVQKILSKNIALFKSIHDPIKYTFKDHLKEAYEVLLKCGKITCEFSCFLIFVFIFAFFVVGAMSGVSTADRHLNVLRTLSYAALFITILLGLMLISKFFNRENFWNYRYKDEDLIRDIKKRSIDRIEYKLNTTNKFYYFKADKFIKDAILYELPNNIIEKLFDLGGRFPTECFGEIIKKCSFDTVKFLVDLGIDVNTKDINGRPAIIEALLNKNFRIIRLLASRNVDAGIEDSLGNTVYDYLRQLPEADAQEIRHILKNFRTQLKSHIYSALTDEKYNFHRECAGIISEFLA